MKGPPMGGPFSFPANVVAAIVRCSQSNVLKPASSCRMRRTRSIQPPRILGFAFLLWFAATMIACGGQEPARGQEDDPMPNKSLEEVLQEHLSYTEEQIATLYTEGVLIQEEQVKELRAAGKL